MFPLLDKAEDYLKKESIAGQVFITGMLNRNFSLNEEICAVGFECKENLLPFAVLKNNLTKALHKANLDLKSVC